MGQGLFSTFAGAMDSEIGCISSKFVNSTKLSSAVVAQEERDASQRDFDRLERWPSSNPVVFSKTKCNICAWVWPVPNRSTDWVRAALRKRILLCWWIRNSPGPSNACSQPRKPTVFWASSKEV